MSFVSIVTTTKTFNERGRGTYIASDVSFGAPTNELRLRPNTNKKTPSIGITRYREQDVTVGTSTVRVAATALLTISMPSSGFSTSDIDVMVAEISEFVSSGNLSRLLQGEA